jgi:predicted chitinase
MADVGNFVRITRRINGGTNGFADRLARLEVATNVLKDSA